MRHKAGHWVWVRHQGRVLSLGEGVKPAWVFGVSFALAARRAHEQALARSEWLLNRTGALAQVGGWVLDLGGPSLTWTEQTKRIHGLPDEYVPDLETAIEFYAPEVRPLVEQVVAHAMETGEGWASTTPRASWCTSPSPC